jgi:hypothetical protein
VFSHFTQPQSGEHIRKVQQALKNVQQLEPDLGIPDFEVNGVYDPAFAKAVYAYKEKRNIRNHANQIDDIIGIKTIRSLDHDAQRRARVDPAPKPKKPDDVPRPLPNCVPDQDCPAATQFEVTMLGGMSGGEIAELSKYWFAIRDTTNGLSALYLMSAYGLGVSATPVSLANQGSPRAFSTGGAPVRVTRFGPGGGLAGASTTVKPIPKQVGVTLVTLQYRPERGGLHVTPPMPIDMGSLNCLPGAAVQGAKLSILSTCRGGPGATRRVLTYKDLIFT